MGVVSCAGGMILARRMFQPTNVPNVPVKDMGEGLDQKDFEMAVPPKIRTGYVSPAKEALEEAEKQGLKMFYGELGKYRLVPEAETREIAGSGE